MPRVGGPNPQLIEQDFTVVCGATDQDTLAAVAPCKGAQLKQATLMHLVVGATTGTFTLVIQAGATPYALTSAITVDADATVGTTQFTIPGIRNVPIRADGDPIKFTTVKTGTVSTGVTFSVVLLWNV